MDLCRHSWVDLKKSFLPLFVLLFALLFALYLPELFERQPVTLTGEVALTRYFC